MLVLRPERERELPNFTRTQKLGRYEHLFELVINSQICPLSTAVNSGPWTSTFLVAYFLRRNSRLITTLSWTLLSKAITNERDLSKYGLIKAYKDDMARVRVSMDKNTIKIATLNATAGKLAVLQAEKGLLIRDFEERKRYHACETLKAEKDRYLEISERVSHLWEKMKTYTATAEEVDEYILLNEKISKERRVVKASRDG